MLRLGCVLLACGAAADHLHQYKKLEHLMTPRSKEPFHFKHHTSVAVPNYRDGFYKDVQKSTFRSPPIKLSNGEAWFTLPTVNRLPFPTPGQPFAVVEMTPDIVAEDGRRPPVSELYPHHWLMYDKLVGGSGDNLGCGGENTFVSNIFGAGAEMRGVHYVYPKGYGYMSSEGQSYWSANIHMINTMDLSTKSFENEPDPAGAAAKACVECTWVKGNTGIACTKGMVGNFACCFDEGRCVVNTPSNRTKTTYYLQYDLYWTTDLSVVKPLRYGVVDTWTCGSYGNIAPNMHKGGHNCDDKLCISEVERPMDKDGTLIWAYCHQHIGAINASMYLNGEYMCTSVAHYGTDPGNSIGNEKGYTTGFDLCMHADGLGGAKSNKTWHVKKGDKIKVRSLYNVEKVDKRILPFPGGEHGGVMGLNYFYLHEDGGYTCSKHQCVATTKDGVDLPTCMSTCKPAPPPAPAKYDCHNGVCAVSSSGVDIDTCQAACG